MVSVVNYACDYDVPHKCDSCNGQMFALLPKAIDTIAIYDRPFPVTCKAYSLLPSRFCAICCAELRSCTMSAKRRGRVGIQVLHCCHREAPCYVYCAIHFFFSRISFLKTIKLTFRDGFLQCELWSVTNYHSSHANLWKYREGFITVTNFMACLPFAFLLNLRKYGKCFSDRHLL